MKFIARVLRLYCPQDDRFLFCTIVMTSLPTTEFVYDANGNLINVLPTGSSSDVIGHNTIEHMGTKPSDGTVLHTSLPLITKERAFGYDSTKLHSDERDFHKITTAHPLVTSDRQPASVDQRPPHIGTSVPTLSTTSVSPPLTTTITTVTTTTTSRSAPPPPPRGA